MVLSKHKNKLMTQVRHRILMQRHPARINQIMEIKLNQDDTQIEKIIKKKKRKKKGKCKRNVNVHNRA